MVVKIEDIEVPSPLAILFLFGQENRFPVQATAQEDVTAIVIPKYSVLRVLSMNETLLKNYLDISADFAARLSRKLYLMSFRNIRQKSDVVLLDRTKRALAEYFGVARPSLEREISRMEADGLITSNRREITLRDRVALVRMVNF